MSNALRQIHPNGRNTTIARHHASPSKRPSIETNIQAPQRSKSRKSVHSAAHAPASPSTSNLDVAVNTGRVRAPEVIDISTMYSSDSDSDVYHDILVAGSWGATPGSSQGTDNSSLSPHSHPPPSNTISNAPSEKKDLAAARRDAPLWALFREDFADDGAPHRIFLPIDSSVKDADVKADPASSEVDLGEADLDEAQRAPSALRVSSPSDKPQRLRKLPPFVVVEQHMRVKVMQKQKDGRPGVPWGVQFYLASLASHGHFGLDELDITAGVNAIRSSYNASSFCALFEPSNQQALWDSKRVEAPIMARRATDRERQVCTELDREAEMLADSRLNGVVGPPGEEMTSFGGRVIFQGRLACSRKQERPRPGFKASHLDFSIKLLPPKLGGSCRFSRRFGSESILRLTMERSMTKEARRFAVHAKTREIHAEISDFFGRTVQIMGRKYRPIICKDETVFYLWIASPDGSPDQPEFDCVWDFVDHHAPFAENARQQLGKFIQRIQLGLSTSVPAANVGAITYVSDLRGDPHPITGEQVIMTDGAGAMSLAVARDVAQQLGHASIPSAIQARIAGAKGVWYLDPNAQSWLPGEEPKRWVQVRKSQNKIKYPRGRSRDLSQKVVDLLGPSRTSSPSSLSKQIILVLHSNGVPIDVFAALQQSELRAIANDVSDWEGPDANVCLRLATVVERLCKIETTRARRSTEAAEHRAQGMSSLTGDNARDPDFEGNDDRDFYFGQDGRHAWNGKPISKQECAYEMLLVGFHPRSCAYLADLLVDIANTAMKRITSRFAISIPRSAEAMVIPDPTGTLEADEIQFRFSGDSITDPDSRLRLQHVPEGDVLVTRHPCLLPTDIRKVRAVVRPELSKYQDVVVFSTKGHTPLASMLSGGDYDGDLIRVFWEPQLVEPFKNSDVKFATCPFEISDAFDRVEETVQDFVAQQAGKTKEDRDRALIAHLVAPAFDPQVRGLYGVMHLYAAWQFGIESAQAVDLAHKFCQCMDAPKTGLMIKPAVRLEDSKKYFAKLPDWAYDVQDDSDRHDWFALENYTSGIGAVKNGARPESVLCRLWAEGQEEVGRLKQQLHLMTEKLRGAEDTAISGLWRQAKELGQIKPEEEEAIRSHVQVMEETFSRTNQRTRHVIETRNREQRNTNQSQPATKNAERQQRSVPLRRVRSEAQGQTSKGTLLSGDERRADGGAVDDLERNDMVERLDGTIEVPTILGSAAEVAARFCQWPKAFAKDHVAKMDRAGVARLALLRASYAYSITYARKPRFAFEMAWRWVMNLKAEATGEAARTGHDACASHMAQGLGSIQMPFATLDVLGLRKRIIARNIESARNRTIEL